MKTNVMRMLDQAKVEYEAVECSIDIENFSGKAVSDLMGIDYKACYKTLALLHEHDLYLCVISVDDELDLKKAAKQIGVKNLEMVHVKDLLKTVGYERGSVSPIGAKKNKGVFFDDEILNHDIVELSAGALGIGIKIKRDALVKYLNAQIKDLVIN